MKHINKPGPSQLARLQKIMPKQEDIQTQLELKTVVGPFTAAAADIALKEYSSIAAGKVTYSTSADKPNTGTALKFDQDKLPLHLLSTEAMNQTAAVLKFGAIKYAEHNWRKGFTWSRPLSAAMRHLTAFNNGEDTDPESGLSHLAHAACCIMFLLEFEKTHKELDDRYKP